jgi:hypothetical protein
MTGELLVKLDAQVGLPTMSGFGLITGHDTTVVPITAIKEMVRQSDHGRAGMIIGIPLDLLILASAAAAIAVGFGWDPMSGY